ncbi:MAG: glucose-6-phosphate dehydrogenase [Calditrichaeota bacterium]|nr:glucose-6-phosphate dehydrogenase [Calditrichota bacterium]RQW03954.1 MAG: glucose-6-phosphate dehydrogenase [Calditrichota bacterium]
MERPANSILTIFGASGDLTKRKLIPALFDLFQQKLLPEKFAVLGVSRTEYSDESFREKMASGVKESRDQETPQSETMSNFLKHVYYESIETENTDEYIRIKKRLENLYREYQAGGNTIYYLALPPDMYEKVSLNLKQQGLQQQNESGNWKRIIIEKPFGYDLTSAIALNHKLHEVFQEDQIYRIDHYLGKETVQNVLAFRFANGIFEPLWNRNYIHHVEVTGAEDNGVENRGRYYDKSGALRDMVQSHLLQIVGLIAMESPPSFNPTAVRNETVKVFQSICQMTPEKVLHNVVRGQYMASEIRGEKIPGYREEKNVPSDSRTETFVALKFYIDNWRWGGVPFFIRTGKRLPTRVTEVVIHFKRTPHRLFRSQYTSYSSGNKLIIRIQPDEGILLNFGMKLPGAGFELKEVSMDFHYSDLADIYLPDAYERLLLDCMMGDNTLYARADAVEACWKFITPILDTWKENPEQKIYGYPAGTWGPREASDLFEDKNEDWRYPCKNLTGQGEYCEL